MSELGRQALALLNKHIKEIDSNTPDFILAEYLMSCLQVFESVIAPRIQLPPQRTSAANTDTDTGTERFIQDRRKPTERRQEHTDYRSTTGPPDRRKPKR